LRFPVPIHEVLLAYHPDSSRDSYAQILCHLQQLKAAAHDRIALRGADRSFNEISQRRFPPVKLVKLCDDPIVARYDDVGGPFVDTSAQARQGADAAVAPEMVYARNISERVPRGANGTDAASVAQQGHGHARRRGPPLRRDYQDRRLTIDQNSRAPLKCSCNDTRDWNCGSRTMSRVT
jgi:hypothetical protein